MFNCLFYRVVILEVVGCFQATPCLAIDQENLPSSVVSIASPQDIQHLLQTSHKSITIQGIQHSQGGQSSPPSNGLSLNLKKLSKLILFPGQEKILRVQAGATWDQILRFLDKHDLSVDVMQSDADFSVGGSVSTNVHGWRTSKPPLISTLVSLQVVTADGSIYRCSRNEKPDLFQAVVGGYGLLGVITEIDLNVVPNHLYQLKQTVIPSTTILDFFTKQIHYQKPAHFFFGRFSLHSDAFLEQIVVHIYEDSGKMAEGKALKTFSLLQKSLRFLFAQTYQSDFFKKIRWLMETSPWIASFYKVLSRNQLLYHSVHNYYLPEGAFVDLLQEFFIPFHASHAFIHFLKSLQPQLSPYLMNVTLRAVEQDPESILSYAPEGMFSFVMFFRGPRTSSFEENLQNLVRAITEKALQLSGTYYLPYRPYQTLEQFQKAYPRFETFLNVKKKYDPKGKFQNQFSKRYLGG